MKNFKNFAAVIALGLLALTSCSKALTESEQSILGKWNGNHEPIQVQFTEDKTYAYSAIEDGVTKPYESGTWSADKGNLILVPDTTVYKDAKTFVTKINFVGEILLTEPLPDITSGSVHEYGTLEEYAKEFGFSKVK